jgi:hypothetical protein
MERAWLLPLVVGLGGLLSGLIVFNLAPEAESQLGGVTVGLMALFVPGAPHMGYGWVQISMSDQLLGLPLWMVVLLPFAKILSTSLSIGSGGSGGIRAAASVRDALAVLAEQGDMVLCVVDEHGRYAGARTRAELENTPEVDRSMVTVQSLALSAIDPLTPDQALDEALEQLADRGVPWLPVVVEDHLVGGLGVRDAGLPDSLLVVADPAREAALKAFFDPPSSK